MAKWERVTVIGDAEFSRMPHDGLFIWRRVRHGPVFAPLDRVPMPGSETEIRYCWDGDCVVRASLTETIAAARAGKWEHPDPAIEFFRKAKGA